MKKNLTELVFILDRSGSMQGLKSNTIGGFNAMLEKQKREPGEAFVSTILFDDWTEALHDRVKASEVKRSPLRNTMSGAAPRCWMPSAEPSTTSETFTSMPGLRMCRSIPFSSSPPTAWKMPAAATRPSGSRR